ncbi:hypothetical protein F5878DRAFT_665818 [Lentinula raphanica]|uniref:Uncharacterized protein n=1 Tax=Lentinula raphanica TaxID=153919 RepID=A0AA38NYZ2_9AGAR|nr:hypothetical protein F5878DRAFT_665818 [Lentinula raphanica]
MLFFGQQHVGFESLEMVIIYTLKNPSLTRETRALHPPQPPLLLPNREDEGDRCLHNNVNFFHRRNESSFTRETRALRLPQPPLLTPKREDKGGAMPPCQPPQLLPPKGGNDSRCLLVNHLNCHRRNEEMRRDTFSPSSLSPHSSIRRRKREAMPPCQPLQLPPPKRGDEGATSTVLSLDIAPPLSLSVSPSILLFACRQLVIHADGFLQLLLQLLHDVLNSTTSAPVQP